MKWILRIAGIIFMTAVLLAIFSPGAVVVSAIVVSEKVAIIWCVINFFVELATGKDIIGYFDRHGKS